MGTYISDLSKFHYNPLSIDGTESSSELCVQF